MYQSPRTRRLHSDLAALAQLRSQSSVFRFSAEGNPPQQYSISLSGKGLWCDRGRIKLVDIHRVEIKLGASYPRTMPEIRWVTPIYHPNISEIGMVCLGGYGTHWVPSVQLDELCIMLWDMARYHNYDVRSPYNRDAATWAASQTQFAFPTDGRPLRDLRAELGRITPSPSSESEKRPAVPKPVANGATRLRGPLPAEIDQNPQFAWIRKFVENLERRYPPGSDRHAQTTLVSRLIERYGPIFNQGGLSEPNNLASSVGAVLSGAEAHAPATDDLANSSQARSDSGRRDLVLYEPVTRRQPEPELPSPDSDDIVFIE